MPQPSPQDGALAPEVCFGTDRPLRKTKDRRAISNSIEDQAVLIYFKGEDLEGSIPLQDKLYELLENNHIGVFDGNEVGGNELVLSLYGPDAELLFEHVEPTLLADEFCRGAKVVIRKGGRMLPTAKSFCNKDTY